MAPMVDFKCGLGCGLAFYPFMQLIRINGPEIIHCFIVHAHRQHEMAELLLWNGPSGSLACLDGLARIVKPVAERVTRDVGKRHGAVQE